MKADKIGHEPEVGTKPNTPKKTTKKRSVAKTVVKKALVIGAKAAVMAI